MSFDFHPKDMPNNPKVSIIIPILNTEKYFPLSIQSVFCQTYKDFEIILVDDGSNMECRVLESKIGMSYPDKVKVLYHDKNYGLGMTRNTGIAASSGDYILFLDSDDCIKDNALEILVQKIEETGADVVSTPGFLIPTESEFMRLDNLWMKRIVSELDSKNLGFFPEDMDERIKKEFFGDEHITSIWTRMYRSSFIKDNQIRFTQARIGEEKLFYLSVLIHTSKIYRIEDLFYVYREREGSITRTNDEDRFNKCKNAVKIGIPYIRHELEKTAFTEETKKEIMEEFMRQMFSKGLLQYILPHSEEEIMEMCKDMF